MSGIVGIYNMNGQPADRALLQRMMDALRHRGPDGSGLTVGGPIGMAHLMFHTTPESLHETQPLRDERGDCCLTLDGRVDNVADLRADLEAAGAKLRSDTDAELVLQAYLCWGSDCAARLIGDFAFALWDGRKRRLLCARDPFGLKPFYYYRDDGVFLWASELRPLLLHPSVRREPNEGMIGEYLACALTDVEETLYRRLFRLPPAHSLLVTATGVRKVRSWSPDPARTIRYRHEDDYAHHFLSLFREAVRCRMRAVGPIGANLSGGLDSSSVVGMAQQLMRDGAVAPQGFQTLSTVFPGLPCDESRFIREVVDRWNLSAHLLPETEPDPTMYARQVAHLADFPDFPNSAMGYPSTLRASELGIRMILTGIGGDEWLTGSYLHYADLLRSLSIAALLRQFREDARASSIIFPPLRFLRAGLWPLVPEPVQRTFRRLLRREGIRPWIAPSFVRRTGLADRLQAQPEKPRFSTFAQEGVFRSAVNGWSAQGNEIGDRLLAAAGIEERHPLHDRRIAEFALAIPEDLRWRNEQPKYLLRQAMRGLLPESVRTRHDKADFSHCFVAPLRNDFVSDRLFNPAIAAEGWIDRDRTRALYRQTFRAYDARDNAYLSSVWYLWMIFGIELWFRTMFLDGDRTDVAPFSHRQPTAAARLFN
jgi:asparagine synthase (glutamine-hydrolysing)